MGNLAEWVCFCPFRLYVKSCSDMKLVHWPLMGSLLYFLGHGKDCKHTGVTRVGVNGAATETEKKLDDPFFSHRHLKSDDLF